MKILIYGSGVIGSYLAHILCAAGHDVSVLARGTRRNELKRNGLVIRHYLQRNTTEDHPRVIERFAPEDRFDAVFAVMQYQQMQAILNDLAAVNTPLVVLVGNNPSAEKMECFLAEHTRTPKKILFAFQGTGGRRENGQIICVRLGPGKLECGFLHSEPDASVKAALSGLFAGTKYGLLYYSDMDAWYKCHLALVLPIAYVCYANGCDLKKSTRLQRKQAKAAIREGYGLLSALGYPILPQGTEQYYERGPKGVFLSALLCVLAKTAVGKLAASDHCRAALAEMQSLNKAFRELRERRPEYPMPNWDVLEPYLPSFTEKGPAD